MPHLSFRQRGEKKKARLRERGPKWFDSYSYCGLGKKRMQLCEKGGLEIYLPSELRRGAEPDRDSEGEKS